MQPDTITLTVTPPILNTIMTALAALPFKDAAPVINNLQQQIQAQLAPPVMRPVAVPDSLPEVAQPVGKSG
jgi:hypothetical protein